MIDFLLPEVIPHMSQEDNHISMSTMASPTPSNQTNCSSASRRPPKKSTLTQQQKNQKRQRATQDQLVTLEMEFNKNPTPNATVRERIAEDINMTERSVQIWFQNRRAKIKLLAKKSIETGEDCGAIPESMRNYLAMHLLEAGKPFNSNYPGSCGYLPYGNGGLMMGSDQSPQGKVVIHHLSCRSLSIGSWRRVGQNAMDLIIFYSPDKRTMTYYINNDQAGYKIEYPFSCIKNVYLENGDTEHGKPSGLVVELSRPPNFFMDSSGSGGFFQCNDFTEDQQASQVFVHHLGGHPKVLSGQLAKLVSLEPFMNRSEVYEHQQRPQQQQQQTFPISAPVSPTSQRPASQPNYNVQPHVGMFQEGWGVNVQAGARMPGHKRQRSRSVPSAIDLSLFNNYIPSFFIQHPTESPSSESQDIYSPKPQQPNALSTPGSTLKIETSAFGMDCKQYPLSATTVNSPSDFASPVSFPHASDTAALSSCSYSSAPNNLPYLSSIPIVDQAGSLVQSSGSPLSYISSSDPVIVNQSPPMSMMHRTPSTDVYNISHGFSNMSDDGSGLNEMYSKHTLNFQIPSPGFQDQQSVADVDINQLVSFDE